MTSLKIFALWVEPCTIGNKTRRLRPKLLFATSLLQDKSEIDSQRNLLNVKNNKEDKWIIYPDGNFNIVWDSIVNTFNLISFILIPLVLASKLQMFNDVRWLEFVLDFVFIVDMFFNFFTAYTTDIKIVTNRKKIALHYLTTFFIVDLIGSVPGFLTGESFKELYILKIARFVNLQRFLVHSNYLLSRFKIFLAVVGIKLVIFLILLVHIFG
jgi:hypothetical protein